MKKILIMENYSYDLLVLRMDYIKFLLKKGYEVFVLVPDDGHVEDIKNEGIKTYTYPLDRKSLNPFKIFKSLKNIAKILKEINPDILHTYRIQPNFIGTLVAKYINKNIKVVNHITGLGYAFTDNSLKARMYRIVSIIIYKTMARKSDVLIFQNDDDMLLLKKYGINNKKFVLVKGSGVDENKFHKNNINLKKIDSLKKELNINEKTFVVITVARLIKEKGIEEFIKAAEYFNKKYNNTLFLSVGWIDNDNPSAIKQEFINKISKQVNNIIFLGKRLDVKELLAISDVFVLQSYYREGIPRAVLEAMAMSLPIITTEMPGCKLTVDNNINGFKIKEKDANELIKVLEKLYIDNDLRDKLAKESRKKFLNEFSNSVIYKQILNTY